MTDFIKEIFLKNVFFIYQHLLQNIYTSSVSSQHLSVKNPQLLLFVVICVCSTLPSQKAEKRSDSFFAA